MLLAAYWFWQVLKVVSRVTTLLSQENPESFRGFLRGIAQVKRKVDEFTFGQVAVHLVVEVQHRLESKNTSTPINDSVDALEYTIDVVELLVVWINVPQAKPKRSTFCQELWMLEQRRMDS